MIILHNHHVASKEASQVYNLYEDIHHHVLHSLKLNSKRGESIKALMEKNAKHLTNHKIGI